MSESDSTPIVIQAEPIRMRKAAAAKYLGISPRSLQYLVSQGRIPFVLDSDNGEKLFLTSDLRRYAENQTRHHADPAKSETNRERGRRGQFIRAA